MAPQISRRWLLITLALVGVSCGVILIFAGQSTATRALGIVLTLSNSFLAIRYYQRED